MIALLAANGGVSWHIDLVFFILLIGFAALGAIGGISRVLKGALIAVPIVLFSLLLTGATAEPMCATPGFRQMENKIAESTDKWGEIYTMTVYKDGSGYYVYLDEDAEEPQHRVALENAAGEGLSNKSKGKTANWLAERFINDGNQGRTTLSRAAAHMFSMIIVTILTLIMYGLIFSFICFLLRWIFKSMHDSANRGARIADRVIGGVMALVLGLLLLMALIGLIRIIGTVSPTVDNYMCNARVCGLIYVNNPLGDILTSIFGRGLLKS